MIVGVAAYLMGCWRGLRALQPRNHHLTAVLSLAHILQHTITPTLDPVGIFNHIRSSGIDERVAAAVHVAL